MPTHQSQSWSAALDQLEAIIASYERVLGQDDDPSNDSWPPPGLGALPPALAPRARVLLTRAQDLELRLTAAKDNLGQPGPPHHRRRPLPPRPTISTDL